MTEKEYRDSAKDYLQEAFKLEKLIRSKMEQIERLESRATSAPQTLDSPTGKSSSNGSKVENMAVSIVMLKDEAEAQSKLLAKKRIEISRTIAKAKSYTHQYVLNERYLLNKSWDLIKAESGFSKDYLMRLHRDALLAIGKLLEV